MHKLYMHALVIFDHEGCGREDVPAEQLEPEVAAQLALSGWGDRAAAIVIAPELEAWFWSESAHVDDVAGWKTRSPGLRDWLRTKQFLQPGQVKPNRPKEALEAALREVHNHPSASLFSKLAEHVSLKSCVDPAFLRFKETVRRWFPLSQ
jgi:hypothetical protein